MLINLWVRDKTNGSVHQVGTNQHDSIEYMDGQAIYVNMQNSMSTLDDYEFIEPPDIDGYVSVTPEELFINERLIHNDLKLLLQQPDEKRQRNAKRILNAMCEKTTPDLKAEIQKIIDNDMR